MSYRQYRAMDAASHLARTFGSLRTAASMGWCPINAVTVQVDFQVSGKPTNQDLAAPPNPYQVIFANRATPILNARNATEKADNI
jgi:hypothetical protein